MGRHFVFVDLAKDGCLVMDGFAFPSKQAGGQACDLARKCKLRSGANTYRQTAVVRRREPAGSGAEIARNESVAHFCRAGSYALEAKHTHGDPFLLVLRYSAQQPYR